MKSEAARRFVAAQRRAPVQGPVPPAGEHRHVWFERWDGAFACSVEGCAEVHE